MDELERAHALIAGRFTRSEPRERARAYLSGLVAGLERKNGWTLAEYAGESGPDGMQRLLRKADWDIDGVRDDLRDDVVEQLGDPAGVLVIDETGFLKKGTASAGVARQYSGTAGRIENCQVGVFLAYASGRGHALVDRELYLPKDWIEDPARCRAADVPQDVEFATKPRLAQAMLARAFAAGVPFRWVSADEAYGQVKYLRVWLEEHDWARIPIRICWRAGRGHWLLARRSLKRPEEIAYYVCFGPRRTTLAQLARIAGSRWRIEECFQQAKNEAGLDHYQVRSYRAWYAHITLSMLAHAHLAVARVRIAEGNTPPPGGTQSATRYRRYAGS